MVILRPQLEQGSKAPCHEKRVVWCLTVHRAGVERQARVALIESTVRLARDKHGDEVLDGKVDGMPSWEETCEPALSFLRKRASREVAGRGRSSSAKSS